MNGSELLQQHTDRLKSRMGAFIPTEQRTVFRGHDLHADLKDMDWIELYVFGITGRRFTPEQLRLLHAMWVYTSYPDARLWNNRVAALAGSSRSTGNLGISAALAASEAAIYGRGIDIRAITFFINTYHKLEKGSALKECVLDEIKTHRIIAGYGRPITSGDERITPMIALVQQLGLDKGCHLQLAFTVEEFLLTGRWRLKMNYGALVAALAADLEFSAREYYLFMFPAFLAGIPPCFIEAAEHPEGTLFPLSCQHIQYEGLGKRPW